MSKTSNSMAVIIAVCAALMFWSSAHAEEPLPGPETPIGQIPAEEPVRTGWGATAIFLPSVERHYQPAEVILPTADDPPGEAPEDPEVILGPAAKCDFPLDVPWPELSAAGDGLVECVRVFMPAIGKGQ